MVVLELAIVFLVVALVAGILGFWGVAGISIDAAKLLFVVFLVLFVASLLFGGLRL